MTTTTKTQGTEAIEAWLNAACEDWSTLTDVLAIAEADEQMLSACEGRQRDHLRGLLLAAGGEQAILSYLQRLGRRQLRAAEAMIAAPTPPAPARVAESFGGTALGGAVTRVGEIASVRRSYLAQRDGTVRGDALLPNTDPRPVEVARDSWATVRAAWLAQIEAEGLYDRRIESWQAIAIDPRDGALMTGHAGGGAAAYTPHAWSQLVSLVATYATPRRPHGAAPAPTLGWLPPFARSLAYEGIRAMAAKRSGGLLLRGFRDPRTGLPALRAVLSPRYPGQACDDAQVAAVLDGVVAPDAPAVVYRDATDETTGHALLTTADDAEAGCRGTIHWRNSEVGSARLSFGAGLSISVVDERAVIIDGRTVGTTEVGVEIESAQGRSARNHTLPTKAGKVVLADDARARLARERIRTSVQAALTSVQALRFAWREALKDFPLAVDGGGSGEAVRSGVAAALIDSLLTDGLLGEGDDAATLATALRDVATSTERLREVPFGSAAWVAAALAVVATRATTIEQQRTLRLQAGQWVTGGWAHAMRRARAP